MYDTVCGIRSLLFNEISLNNNDLIPHIVSYNVWFPRLSYDLMMVQCKRPKHVVTFKLHLVNK